MPTYAGLFDRMHLGHHLHFWTAFGWIALLFFQPFWIRAGKLSFHRTLGILGVGLFTAFYATSMYVAWCSAGDAAVRLAPRQWLPRVDILAVNFARISPFHNEIPDRNARTR